MIITRSAVSLASQHASLTQYSRQERLLAWKGTRPQGFDAPPDQAGQTDTPVANQGPGRGRQQGTPVRNGNPFGMVPGFFADPVSFSSAGRQKATEGVQPERLQSGQGKKTSKAEAIDEFKAKSREAMEMELLTHMLEVLTGRRFSFMRPESLLDELDGRRAEVEQAMADIHQAVHEYEQARHAQPPPQAEPQGWGLEYDLTETYIEQERTDVSAAGKVMTADGREIDFTVQVSMSRSFMEHNEIHLRAGDAKLTDPLVINFDGTAAQLTNTTFQFDLDADGQEEQISRVAGGSGILALDRNNDGRINDGRELFGPTSGNGFNELASFDEDGNNWIDENDAVFHQLRIWTRDANGEDRLVGLGEKGVGAIYLGNVSSPFSLKDQSNNLLGQIQSTGVYLMENGAAGVVQQLDLAARNPGPEATDENGQAGDSRSGSGGIIAARREALAALEAVLPDAFPTGIDLSA